MKYKGKKLDGPPVEVVVIPRQTEELVFKAQAVLNYDDFEKLAPVPTPPKVVRPGGIESYDTEDKKYNESMDDWASLKFHWMILKSLQATEELEWETVNMSDPSTWDKYESEMAEAGLSPAEIDRIKAAVIDACGLNQAKIDEATKRFLAGQAAAHAAASSPSIAPSDTPSGEPANASA